MPVAGVARGGWVGAPPRAAVLGRPCSGGPRVPAARRPKSLPPPSDAAKHKKIKSERRTYGCAGMKERRGDNRRGEQRKGEKRK